MKKVISIVLVLVFVLSGCGTGIEPNVPTKVEDIKREVETSTEPTEDPSEVATDQVTEAPTEETEPAIEEVDEAITTDNTEETTDEITDETAGDSVEEASGDSIDDTIEETSDEAADEVTLTEKDEAVEEDQIGVELPVISAPVVHTKALTTSEVRAVWLSYLDLQPMFASNTEAGYRQSLAIALDNISEIGMNTVMYQVRPFGDALYKSSLFPTSYIVTGTEGAMLGFDPLEIAVQMAHDRSLRIEAWVNPYRIRTATSSLGLSENNIAKVWYEDGSRRVLRTKEGALTYNPALEEVQDYIIAGVKEIIDHYAVDGIHFDDYFYPTTDMTFDEIDYLSYQYDADPMPQDVYRRNNVNQLVKKVYDLVHSYNRELVFGISPQGNIETNYNQLFVDIPMWLSAGGYVDYICPQVYFGFSHERTPYEAVMDDWAALIQSDVDLLAGLAVYKVGVSDQWAGTGSEEWVQETRILQRMIETAEGDSHYGGYALFRYGSLFNPSMELLDKMEDELMGILETLNQ